MPRFNRKRWAGLAGAILLTIALPVAIDQGFFRYNPYLLPIIGLIAVLLYLLFFVTSNMFLKWAQSFYAWSHIFSIITFIIIFLFIITIIVTAEWFAICKNKEHINKMLPQLTKKTEVSQTTQATPKEKAEKPVKKRPPRAIKPTPKKEISQLEPTKESPADVALRFVYPKEPALVITNLSDSVARDIKWTVILWNMDLPDRNDPLPIPVENFDWLRGHKESAPLGLFNRPLVAPLLKSGNRLFGCASIDCPGCSRGRTYIVYIVWGQSGWFSKIENEKSGQVFIPKSFLKDSRERYFGDLEAASPEKSRLPIGEW